MPPYPDKSINAPVTFPLGRNQTRLTCGIEHAHDQRLRDQSAPADHLGDNPAQLRLCCLVGHERHTLGLRFQPSPPEFPIEHLQRAFVERLLKRGLDPVQSAPPSVWPRLNAV